MLPLTALHQLAPYPLPPAQPQSPNRETTVLVLIFVQKWCVSDSWSIKAQLILKLHIKKIRPRTRTDVLSTDPRKQPQTTLLYFRRAQGPGMLLHGICCFFLNRHWLSTTDLPFVIGCLSELPSPFWFYFAPTFGEQKFLFFRREREVSQPKRTVLSFFPKSDQHMLQNM